MNITLGNVPAISPPFFFFLNTSIYYLTPSMFNISLFNSRYITSLLVSARFFM